MSIGRIAYDAFRDAFGSMIEEWEHMPWTHLSNFEREGWEQVATAVKERIELEEDDEEDE